MARTVLRFFWHPLTQVCLLVLGCLFWWFWIWALVTYYDRSGADPFGAAIMLLVLNALMFLTPYARLAAAGLHRIADDRVEPAKSPVRAILIGLGLITLGILLVFFLLLVGFWSLVGLACFTGGECL